MTGVTLIAEIGQAHDGSLGILHSYIDVLSDSGINVIKFQTHIAEAESSAYEPFRTNFSYVDATRYDYWNRMSFSQEEWQGIKSHCEEAGLEFMSSPFSIAAVNLLESIGIDRYKVGSGEVNNLLMLDRIGRTKKPIILSTGMSSFSELNTTIQFLKPYGNDISILQCTTQYPTSPEKWGLNVLKELRERYPDKQIGYSDHSGDIYASLAAASLGADLIEFHVAFDKRMFGPDSSSSLAIDQVKQLAQGVREIQCSLANPVQKDSIKGYQSLRDMFGKSLAVNKDLPLGHIIQLEDLESKKPGNKGISASEYNAVIGKKLKTAKIKYDFLSYEDLLA